MGQFEKNSNVLRVAIRDGVVDTSLGYFGLAPFRAMEWLQAQDKGKPPFLSIDQNPEALRTQVHTFGRTTVFDPEVRGLDYIIELARIVVPENNIGYLENIEQYLADKDGQFYATASQKWGIPYNETLVSMDLIKWAFQLEAYTGSQPEPFAFSSATIVNYRSILPGLPWTEINEIEGLWYPATQYHGIRANIAPGHMLRFFAFVPDAALDVYSWRLAGTLTARLQSELCNEAHQNTRLTFQ